MLQETEHMRHVRELPRKSVRLRPLPTVVLIELVLDDDQFPVLVDVRKVFQGYRHSILVNA